MVGGGPFNNDIVSLRSSALPSTSVSADLMGGPIVHAQRAGGATDIDANGFPRKWLLKILWPMRIRLCGSCPVVGFDLSTPGGQPVNH
jgi:hypothetical protein